jgi:FlaA1/EpsC-like NDP-sugar epimerase
MVAGFFHLRNRFLFLLDAGLIILGVLASFALRLDIQQFYLDYLPTALTMLVLALPIKLLVYYRFGLYRRYWAYASTREMLVIIAAVTAAALLLSITMFGLFMWGLFEFFPRSVVGIDWLISLLLVGGLRFSIRALADYRRQARSPQRGARNVLVVGAGDAGALVVRELEQNPQLDLVPYAFLDDDPLKRSVQIRGLNVVGNLLELNSVLAAFPIDEVIFAIPSAPGTVLRTVADACRAANVPFRTMPGIYELLGGVVSVSRLRPVEITDLLRRKPVRADDERVGLALRGKRVLVTGAGGSIASELCRQIARWSPSELVLVGHGENSIFEILLELEKSFPALALQPVIADVRHRTRLDQVFKRYQPEVVFHAAAHKHVPLMERNVEEAVTNNVEGTRNVVDIALAYAVHRLVMISTDKAVQPTSVMGATKRFAEMLVLDAAQRGGLPFSVVRFGNVLGSRGSVVPRFNRQIHAGGPVSVTHPDMERYFMTIPEAVYLVLLAFAMGQGGEVFLLNMGEPVRILQLAEDLIRLSGLEPGRDIEIEFSGLRPGEKLTEELYDPGKATSPTDHPDIMRLNNEHLLMGAGLQDRVDELVKLAHEGDVDTLVQLLDEVIPGAAIRSTPPPDLTTIL